MLRPNFWGETGERKCEGRSYAVCVLFCYRGILPKINSLTHSRARGRFQKTILTDVFLQWPVFYTLKPLQTLCLRTLVDVLAFHPLQETFSLPLLAGFVFTVGQGGIQTMGRRCYLFNYQSSSGSEINGQPYHVWCGSAGRVVSIRDPFHVTRVYRAPPPATWLVEINLKWKKMKRLVHWDLSSSAIRL